MSRFAKRWRQGGGGEGEAPAAVDSLELNATELLLTLAENTAPVATITSPEGSVTPPGATTVTLAGYGTDAEQGTLTGDALAWASDVDGALGTGSPLVLPIGAVLTPGVHRFTLIVTDAGGLEGTAYVDHEVVAPAVNEEPTVEITAPNAGRVFADGEAIALRATGLDTEDGALVPVWTSNLDGLLGEGDLDLTAGVELSAGAQEVTATVTDSGGQVATATRAFTVSEPTDPTYPYAGWPSTVVYVANGPTGGARLPDVFMDTKFVQHEAAVVHDADTFTGATPADKLQAVLTAIANGTIMGTDVVEFSARSTGTLYSTTVRAIEAFYLPQRPVDADGLPTTRDTNPDIAARDRWITFRTKRHDELPEGVRVQPYAELRMERVDPEEDGTFVIQEANTDGPDRDKFATFATSGIGAVISTPRYSSRVDQRNCAYYRFIGIEFTNSNDGGYTKRLVNFGPPAGDESPPTPNGFPHHLILDRCFLNGKYGVDEQRGCLGVHGDYIAMVDSWSKQIGQISVENHNITAINGRGPVKLVNNTIVGGSIGVMCGGATGPEDIACIPNDWEVRRNLFAKDPSHHKHDTTFAGSATAARIITYKNLTEWKMGQRVLIEGNVYRNMWEDDQNGACLLLKAVHQSGRTGTSSTETMSLAFVRTTDFVVRYNDFSHVASWLSVIAKPEGNGTYGDPDRIVNGVPSPLLPSPPRRVAESTRRVYVAHNRVTRLGGLWSRMASGGSKGTSNSVAYLGSSRDRAGVDDPAIGAWEPYRVTYHLTEFQLEQNTIDNTYRALLTDTNGLITDDLPPFRDCTVKNNIIRYGVPLTVSGAGPSLGIMYDDAPSANQQDRAAFIRDFDDPASQITGNVWLDVPADKVAGLPEEHGNVRRATAALDFDEELRIGEPTLATKGADIDAVLAYTAGVDDLAVPYPSPVSGREYA